MPLIEEVKLGVGVCGDDLYAFAGVLKERGEFLEALFVYKLAYQDFIERRDAMGITNCIIRMPSRLLAVKNEDFITKSIVVQYTGTVQEAMRFIDGKHISHEEKINYKAKCLDSIGRLFCGLGFYSDAIRKYDEGIELMRKSIPNPDQFNVYGGCFNNKGSALKLLGKYMDSLACYKFGLISHKKAIDFPNDQVRDGNIKQVEKNINMVKSLMK